MAIACSCHGVRDHAIREVIADGAATVDDVVDSVMAGGNCGGCVPTIETLLAAERALDAALGPARSSVSAA